MTYDTTESAALVREVLIGNWWNYPGVNPRASMGTSCLLQQRTSVGQFDHKPGGVSSAPDSLTTCQNLGINRSATACHGGVRELAFMPLDSGLPERGPIELTFHDRPNGSGQVVRVVGLC